MFWKIMLFLYVFCSLIFMSILSSTTDVTISTPWAEAILSYFGIIIFVFICGYFYSLGWKKQIFSPKVHKFMLPLFILSIILTGIFTFVFSALHIPNDNFFKFLMQEFGYNYALLCYFVSISISFFIQNIIYWVVPFIAYYFYGKQYSEFSQIEKPFWKIFTTYYILLSFTSNIIFHIKMNSVISTFTVIDYIVCYSSYITMVVLVGYSFNKKILPQIVWKILSIPYLIIVIIGKFIVSPQFLSIMHSHYCKPCATLDVIIILFLVYAICKYSYSNEIYEIKQTEL